MAALITWPVNLVILLVLCPGWKIWVVANFSIILSGRFPAPSKPIFRIIIMMGYPIYGYCLVRVMKGFFYLPIWVMENSVKGKYWDSRPFTGPRILNWMTLITTGTRTFYTRAETMRTIRLS